MYKIAICDDENFTCAELESMVLKIGKKLDLNIDTEVFFSGEGLCKNLEQENYYDIIFLDIELVNISGIEVGNFIRNDRDDEKTVIIYISSKEQYALRLFKVRPFDFLIKPLVETEIEGVIIEALKNVNKGRIFFEFNIGKYFYRKNLGDIIYFQSDKRKVIIVMLKERIEFYGNLLSVKKQLPVNDFIQIHKSYIINYSHAKEYTYEWVKMINDEVISISKSYRKAVRNRVLQDRSE